MPSIKFPALVFALTSLVFSPFTVRAQDVLDGVAAVANNDVITFSQVRELTTSLEASAKGSLSGAALAEKVKEIRLRAVNDLVDRQLILQEFRKNKFTIPPYIVDDRINVIIREEFGGDKSAFLRTLAAQGFTLDKLRKLEEEKVIVQAMRSREAKGDVLIPESKIVSYYQENIQEWTVNEEIKLRTLAIRHGDAAEKNRKVIEEIREKIVRGADFGDLARIYSEDSKQDVSGEWGWVDRKTLNPELTEAAFSQKTGKVSEVISLSGSFYLMLVEERKSGISKPLSEVRTDIERRLIQVEKQKLQLGWLERLRKKAYIKIF